MSSKNLSLRVVEESAIGLPCLLPFLNNDHIVPNNSGQYTHSLMGNRYEESDGKPFKICFEFTEKRDLKCFDKGNTITHTYCGMSAGSWKIVSQKWVSRKKNGNYVVSFYCEI